MRSIKLFAKMSLSYWRTHKLRLITFLITMIVGTAALYSAAALIRSNKEAILDNTLTNLGDYDIFVYNLKTDEIDKIKNLQEITNSGNYTELGYAQSTTSLNRIKIASFADKQSEVLYHMPCKKGFYPTQEGEVAIDINTAKALGIRPEIGNTMELQLYNLDSSTIKSQTFTIVGIFNASDESVYGGWLRYPISKEPGTYDMPGIFLSSTMNSLFNHTNICAFFQTEEDVNKVAGTLNSLLEDNDTKDIDISSSRAFAYGYIIGGHLEQETLANVLSAMKERNVIKDFYSGVLIPILGILIFLVSLLSMYCIVKCIVNDKQEQFAILRSIGVRAHKAGLYFFIDFMVLTVIATVIGVVLGILIHLLMIEFMNHTLGLSITNAFNASDYVKAVTLNPFSYSFIIAICSTLMASIVPIIRFINTTPAALLQNLHRHKNIKRNRPKLNSMNWLTVLRRRMKLFDGNVAIITIIAMSTIVFAYVYFCALSDLDSSELQWQREEYNLAEYDYTAAKSDTIGMYDFNIENHHDFGIPLDSYNQLLQHDYIKNCKGYILNKSTRLSYPKNSLSDEMQEYLSKLSLRDSNVAETDFDQNLIDAKNAMIAAIGYSDDEYIYSIPTIGITTEELEQYNQQLIAGTIDTKAIANGSEIILAVPETEKENMLQYFNVGDSFPLSDIVLSEQEEQYDFMRLIPKTVTKPVYEKDVVTNEGDAVTLTSFAFGKRKNITTTIGAIVTFDDQNEELPLLSEYLDSYTPEDGYGIYALCGFDTFANWGLPDDLLTNVKISLKESADMEVVDTDWYNEMGKSKGISIRSIKELTDKQTEIKIKNMTTYYMIMGLLLLLSLIATMIVFYGKIRLKGQELAYLQFVGMRRSQIYWLLIRESIGYPLLGVIASLIPVALCQLFFLYIRKMIDSGIWGGSDAYSLQVPWYHYVPFRYDLYDYNIITLLLSIFILYILLIHIAMLPSYMFIKKQVIIEEIEINTF